MNRREALLTILLAPGGQFSKDNGTTFVGSSTWAASLKMQLADKAGDGITYLEVTYNGKSKKFSAKELWDALTSEDTSPVTPRSEK